MEFTSRIKLVESDKKLLQEECDELREAMRTLESNVDDELKQLDGETTGADTSGDVQRALREAKAKYEVSVFHRLLKTIIMNHPYYLLFCSWNSASFAKSRLRRNRNMLK